MDESATQLALALEGTAVQVLLDLAPADQRDLRALTRALERRFVQRAVVNHSRELLTSRRRHEGERLGAYAADVQLYAQRGYPDFPAAAREELALHSFLQGLAPPRLGQHVRPGVKVVLNSYQYYYQNLNLSLTLCIAKSKPKQIKTFQYFTVGYL